MATTLHDDEIPIDVELVRGLVDRAMPNASGLRLTPVETTGSSNSIFRLGDELAVRLPRQPGGSASIDKEARWLPMIARELPVPVPEVLLVADPDLGFPERWSIVRWLPGHVPSPAIAWQQAPTDTGRLAADLAECVAALRRIDVDDAALADPALSSYRGHPLVAMDESFHSNLEQCRNLTGRGLDLDTAEEIWTEVIGLPASSAVVDPRWYHGDLLAENLLVDDGRLCGVLDFGGVSIGNPTIDLIVAWELLDPPARQQFRTELDIDEQTWLVAMAWTLAIAVMTFPYYGTTMPDRCSDRRLAAGAVLADWSKLRNGQAR